MEHITEPWQVVLLIVVALVAGVVMCVWFYAGIDHERAPEEFDPGMLIQRGWVALLHWRPVPTAPHTPEPERTLSDDFPLPAGLEPHDEPGSEPFDLALNAAEVIAVARMIGHNKSAAKPSKSSTIAAGFGVSRGGSAAYTRASVIYDALFGPPPPAVHYRERTPEQDALRSHLRLGK